PGLPGRHPDNDGLEYLVRTLGPSGERTQAARPAPPGRRARAARVPRMWPSRARLRAPLVPHVSDQRALPVFLPGPELLSVMRKEEAAPVGGVVAEGSARAGPASSCRPHHAAPAPRDLPQAARASARPRAVRGGGRRRVCEETGRSGRAA